MANDIGGVWRTIGGRRVFIKDGQDLASAMKESGKFKSAKKFSKREELKKDIAHQVTEAEKNGNTAHAEIGKRELERLNNEEKEQAVKDYENGKISADEVLNKFYGQEDKMKEAFEKMGYTAPTKENIDKANKRHEEFMNNLKNKEDSSTKEVNGVKLLTPRDKEKGTYIEDLINQHNKLVEKGDTNYKTLQSLKKEIAERRKTFSNTDDLTTGEKTNIKSDDKRLLSQIEQETDSYAYKELLGEYNAGKVTTADLEDTLKTLKKFNNDTNDYEYNLYKQAKENPDSINPMTEWSTDWEDLDKRFKDRYEKDNQKWLTEKDSNWLKNQGHDTELEKKIKNFKPSGDIENDERRLEDISSNYFYDEVGIYNENIDSTATKWAHDKAVELNDKNKQKKAEMLVPIDPYKPEDEARKILGLDSKNKINDLMTAEQLKGKDREEQKEINKQYLKEQNKLAKEKGLISDYNKTDSRGSMSDDSFIEQARKNGMSDEQIAKEVYKKHNGPESNNTSDNNIKRLLAKQAKEEALAKGDKKRAESFENYEKNFAEREKRDKMGQYAYLLEKQRNRGNSKDEKPNELQNKANKVVEAKIKTPVNQLSGLKDRYYKANSDREKNQIREYTKSALEAVKEGTTLGLVTKESNAGWTSMGGWHDENTTVKKYTKIGPNKWNTPYGVKTDEDMILTALYNEEPLRDLQEANDIAGIKSMGDKSSFRYYGNNGPNRVTYKNQSSNDVMNNNIRNAYEEYKKKHPGSKINFSKFKDNYKS